MPVILHPVQNFSGKAHREPGSLGAFLCRLFPEFRNNSFDGFARMLNLRRIIDRLSIILSSKADRKCNRLPSPRRETFLKFLVSHFSTSSFGISTSVQYSSLVPKVRQAIRTKGDM